MEANRRCRAEAERTGKMLAKFACVESGASAFHNSPSCYRPARKPISIESRNASPAEGTHAAVMDSRCRRQSCQSRMGERIVNSTSIELARLLGALVMGDVSLLDAIGGVIAIVIAFGLFGALATFLIRLARVAKASAVSLALWSAQETLAKDPRERIVVLRSFADDDAASNELGRGVRVEQLL